MSLVICTVFTKEIEYRADRKTCGAHMLAAAAICHDCDIAYTRCRQMSATLVESPDSRAIERRRSKVALTDIVREC